jgi:hypothetical protein
MIPDALRRGLLVTLLLLGTNLANAETLTINVMDEQNRGIHSRVSYKIAAPPPSVLGDTDNQGKLVRSHDCTPGQVFTARPYDIGSYFESTEEPCKAEVTLRVISRRTPIGPAVQFRVESIKFPDGSPGVIIYKGVVKTRASEFFSGVVSCQVEVDPVVEQNAFKTDSASWKAVARNEVSASEIFSGPEWTKSKSIILPYGCDASGSRIQALGADTATELSRRLVDSMVFAPHSMRTLGLQ